MSALLPWMGSLIAMHAGLLVSGFAQSDAVSMRTIALRSAVDVARAYRPLAEPSPDDVELPPNLIVPPLYRDVVESLRLRSPTFRRQCLRIASAAKLTVVLEEAPPPSHLDALAWTRVAHVDGRLDAVIRVRWDRPAPQLIAHELEHVIEQLDGIDLARKARLDSSGVHECRCGSATAFETARAVRVGLQVASEMRSHRP